MSLSVKEALELILRHTDYNAGHIGPMQAVSDVLPHWVLRLANEALEESDALIEEPAKTNIHGIGPDQAPSDPIEGQTDGGERKEFLSPGHAF